MRTSNKELKTEQAVVEDPRWARIVARDKSADGLFWYTVATTGIYCRPSCPSRTAKPRNVRIHDTLASAKATGFRACRRCNPEGMSVDAENAAIITKICRILDAAVETPSLGELADAVDLSPSYFHRLFKRATGLSPKAYAAARRAARVREGLATARTVTEAIYRAGFASTGRFYSSSTKMLGMRPSAYRSGGACEVITFAVAQCSLGAVLVASSDKGVAAISLGDDPELLVRELQDRFANAQLVGGDADYEKLVATVVGFVEEPARGLALPLDVRGTAFQQRVWQELRNLPVGATATYSSIAERIGAPKAVRAVAGACAANTLAIAIPCHRVIRHDGTLSGYRWGIERKRKLLERESEHRGRAAGRSDAMSDAMPSATATERR
ncbi:MAG: bifunctional DNA-binding transcriptional regulator/O6-methylguanine-DNA methyltransferase Ada [Polyangiaceae bacterium]|jgi:AraC family transcriptional regulator of adaptative response/methylated-DNA-[protein]-cysteine methyltransferase